jgi:glycerophosphoryl diester phosphodiesterase
MCGKLKSVCAIYLTSNNSNKKMGTSLWGAFFMRFQLLLFFSIIVFTTCAQSFQGHTGTLVAAHRCGFYPMYPENSIELAQHVINHTYGTPVVFEFDIRKSKEGTLFVMHDEKVDRTTNGSGFINEITDSTLRAMHLTSLNKDSEDSYLLPVREWLDSLDSEVCFFMFDVKDGDLNQVVELIKVKNVEDRSVLLLFTPERFSEFNSIKTELAFSYLVENEAAWKLLQNSSPSSKRKFAYITRRTPIKLIEEMKASGIRIMSDVSEFQRNAGNIFPADFYKNFVKENMLDIVITDFPIEVVDFLKK